MNYSTQETQIGIPQSEQISTEDKQALLDDLRSQIDALPYLDAEYKLWAKQDVEKRLGNTSEADLLDKYVFYDGMAKLRNDILQNVPEKKRTAVLGLINELLDEPTHGERREMKADSMKRIERICREYATNKSLLRFTLERMEGEFEKRVYRALNKDDRADYKKYYEKVFTKDFWHLWEKSNINPQEFPHITGEFLYFSPLDMKQHVTLEDVQKIPKSFHKALLSDAQSIIAQGFPLSEGKKALDKLKRTHVSDMESGLLQILALKEQQEKHARIIFLARIEISDLIKTKNPEKAENRIKGLVKLYGKSDFEDLQNKISTLKSEIENNDKDHKKKEVKQSTQKKKQTLLQKIRRYILAGTAASLALATSEAKNLEKIDPYEAKKQKDRIEQVSTTFKKESFEEKVDHSQESLGLEKQMKVKFIDRCIEHAQKTKEACGELGIPTNHPDFWGPEGCKNRVKWLKDHGKWDEYLKLNSNDKNIPSQRNGSMHYRWLDLRTGSNLTAGKAEQGLKYLDRYKDSGYRIAALGAGFSMDWKSYGSPTYDPDRFIDLCNAEKNRIMGGK